MAIRTHQQTVGSTNIPQALSLGSPSEVYSRELSSSQIRPLLLLWFSSVVLRKSWGVYSVAVPANYPSRLQLPANSAVPQTRGIYRNPPISVEVSRGIAYTPRGEGGILIVHYTD